MAAVARSQPMRILVACDKFKESLAGPAVNAAIAQALQHALPNCIVSKMCMSDGGDGWIDSLRSPLQLEIQQVQVKGPYGKPVTGQIGVCHSQRLAVIEMAAASGLELTTAAERNPLHASTFGLGQLIKAACATDCSELLLGIGGSATNDGGIGALHALGLQVELRDRATPEQITGRDLQHIQRLSLPGCDWAEMQSMSVAARAARARQVLLGRSDRVVRVACDVTNPFTGPQGATAVFSAQKGATAAQQVELEAGMVNLTKHLELLTGVSVEVMPGAGAAGGVGGGFAAVLGAELQRGVVLLSRTLGLERAIADADLIVTGEGSYDAQTFSGKVVSHVKDLGRQYNKPVVVVCGVSKVPEVSNEAVLQLTSQFPLDACMHDTAQCLEGLIKRNSGLFERLLGRS
ncbi:hypothetical protein CAOG_05805 [Capsaspora owczarzaki ATCC 30864]|uniref:Glycerate kinase n=1 Tax=Capsaspora owczarzaki (strain ATCC 30864) TaxID=595528 RepID=A0A0D2WSS9_CAPO3|nr:hypothetical protein CAOG_05805 [Capsaspora owczarzaki ATCC 30864]KJE95350.1 hypothetical protein CAOG_005805 [Capsaspora owczarzaki ATCC 30864]|eukprot:XP_004345395.2 hypothetical protein CAOG_05805 [Capsaspora owczarzaki ATCC 30864]